LLAANNKLITPYQHVSRKIVDIFGQVKVEMWFTEVLPVHCKEIVCANQPNLTQKCSCVVVLNLFAEGSQIQTHDFVREPH